MLCQICVGATANARRKATEGKSSANFIDDQRDDGKSNEFIGYKFSHSQQMLTVSLPNCKIANDNC